MKERVKAGSSDKERNAGSLEQDDGRSRFFMPSPSQPQPVSTVTATEALSRHPLSAQSVSQEKELSRCEEALNSNMLMAHRSWQRQACGCSRSGTRPHSSRCSRPAAAWTRPLPRPHARRTAPPQARTAGETADEAAGSPSSCAAAVRSGESAAALQAAAQAWHHGDTLSAQIRARPIRAQQPLVLRWLICCHGIYQPGSGQLPRWRQIATSQTAPVEQPERGQQGQSQQCCTPRRGDSSAIPHVFSAQLPRLRLVLCVSIFTLLSLN